METKISSPIGLGKTYHDIIMRILGEEKVAAKHYVNLRSNCRQENDENILKLAEAFTDKKRYYEEALEIINREGKISGGLYIYKWKDKEDLEKKITDIVENVIGIEIERESKELKEKLREDLDRAYKKQVRGKIEELDEIRQTWTKVEQFNHLLGLYKTGYVNNQDFRFKETLQLDNLQLLTPYRAGYYGILGINKLVQGNYRLKTKASEDKDLYHSDKIIRVANWYTGWGKNRRLRLSNGSIGIVVGEGSKRQYYFKEVEKPLFWIDSEDNFELAYSITIHKSQGSDFKNVLLIIPRKLSLLCKELIYTALTRSKYRLFIFIQESEENLFLRAKNTSHVLMRNTSIFRDPEDNRKKYYPEKGEKPVRSKIEWIIYKALKAGGLDFNYEEELKLKKREYVIHPDFTIHLSKGRVLHWEHLGMLDIRKYYNDWQTRKKDYEDHNLLEGVITTDDLDGIKQERIDQIIEEIRKGKLKDTKGSKFSKHHYQLY